MDPDVRVCPFCGEPPGPGTFCAACGRNLSAVERLPTAGQWRAERGEAPRDGEAQAGAGSLAQRCAAATRAFLEAMHAAGDPGVERFQAGPQRAFRRTPHVEGWMVRPVARDDDARPRRYEPGLLLTVEGAFHRLDNEVRGWGQRDFPQYHHTVEPDPLPAPADERLPDELRAVLEAHGVASA